MQRRSGYDTPVWFWEDMGEMTIGKAKDGNPHGAKPCTQYSMSHPSSLRNCLPSTPCKHSDALPHSSSRGATGTTQPVHERVRARSG